jgi:hypothetical protein
MSIDLPTTEHSTARELAAWCSDTQLSRAITYLEMVRIGQIDPGPEIDKLLGEDSLLTWNTEEIDAVQRRLALTLCIKRSLPYLITNTIRECVFRYRMEVLRAYFGENYGRANQQSCNGSRNGSSRG